MAYDSKATKTDVNAKPIPQLYNPVTDEYEVLQGTGGAARQVLYGPDGQPVSIVDNKLAVRAEEIETLLTALTGKDFATQTTLAQILAKMIASPATEAKQAEMLAALGNQSTAAKQDALAGLVGALDAAAVSDPAAAGAVIALLKGVLSRLHTLEGKIDGITDGTTPATTQLTGSKVGLKKVILSDTSEVAAGGEASIQTAVPDGKIWTIQNIDMVTRPPDNATTGNHYMRIYAGAEISIVRAVYNRRLQYVYGGYLDGSQNLMPIEDAAPKEPLVQALVFKGVKISKNMPLQFRYTNTTDVVQTNSRTINLAVLEECITS